MLCCGVEFEGDFGFDRCVWGLSNMVLLNVVIIMVVGVVVFIFWFVLKWKVKSDYGECVEDEELEDGEFLIVGVVFVMVVWDCIECILCDKCGNVIKRLL